MSAPGLPSHLMLIPGMHRSGSSALTRVLSMLGYRLPKTLIKDNASNRRGHWESRPIVRLDEAFMQDMDLAWSDWTAGSLATVRSQRRRDFETDLVSVVSDEFTAGAPAIVKDPRICRLIPFYRSALEPATPLSAVIPIRNPLEVIASLVRRNNLSETHAALLWLRYTLDAVAGSTNMPRAFIAYERLLSDPLTTLKEAESALGTGFPVRMENVAEDIEAFLSFGLRHHSHSMEDLLHNDLTHGWISDTYAALRILTRSPEDPDALETIDRVRQQMEGAEPLLEHVICSYDGQIEELSRSRAAMDASAELRRKQVEDLRITVSSLESQKSELEERVSVLEQQVRDQNATVESLRAENRTLSDNLEKQITTERKLRADFKQSDSVYKREISRLRIRAEELEASVDAHRAAMDAIYNSKSWRLTRPVRSLTTLLRGRGEAPLPSPAKPEKPKPKLEAQPETLPEPAAVKPDPADVERLEQSPLFDAAYYVGRYPEAAAFSGGPAAHYIAIGWRKGYDPSAAFTSRAYEQANADLLAKDECPLLHFLDAYPGGVIPAKRALTETENGRPPRVAVFTAITGNYDELKEPLGPTDGADFFVFTDGPVAEGSVWQRRDLEYVDNEPTRSARFVKTHPYLYFSDYDYAIWIDANLALRCDPRELLPGVDDPRPLHTWCHPLRICVYEEGEICIEMKKDDPDLIRADMEQLQQEGFPRNAGLFETSVFVTRMSDPRIRKFYERWWNRIEKGSRRDQLSLPAVVHESGIELGYVAPERICMRSDPRFTYERHAAHEPQNNKKGTAA